MKSGIKAQNQATSVPAGFFYVAQDNYHLINLDQSSALQPVSYLYSDGATSCIIVIVVGKNAADETVVALSHLSKRASFEAFFEQIESYFRGAIRIYAQGANPPAEQNSLEDSPDDACQNADLLRHWIAANQPKTEALFYISEVELALSEGNPLEANRDCLGIDLRTLKVSNQRLAIALQDRDVYGGLQTLFSLFGAEMADPLILHAADQPFTQVQISNLVNIAYNYQWQDILALSDEDMLHYFSTTPQYEVPWFCDSLRQSAQFVIENLHLVTFSK